MRDSGARPRWRLPYSTEVYRYRLRGMLLRGTAVLPLESRWHPPPSPRPRITLMRSHCLRCVLGRKGGARMPPWIGGWGTVVGDRPASGSAPTTLGEAVDHRGRSAPHLRTRRLWGRVDVRGPPPPHYQCIPAPGIGGYRYPRALSQRLQSGAASACPVWPCAWL